MKQETHTSETRSQGWESVLICQWLFNQKTQSYWMLWGDSSTLPTRNRKDYSLQVATKGEEMTVLHQVGFKLDYHKTQRWRPPREEELIQWDVYKCTGSQYQSTKLYKRNTNQKEEWTSVWNQEALSVELISWEPAGQVDLRNAQTYTRRCTHAIDTCIHITISIFLKSEVDHLSRRRRGTWQSWAFIQI